MKQLIAAILFSAICGAAEFPAGDETLNYTINWPSGLSLGEGHLRAHRAADRWEFEMTIEATIPAFGISDRYHSEATGNFCSLEFDKQTIHGKKKSHEKVTFDSRKNVARRVTMGGGKSEIPISACTRDALAYLFYARRELASGRIPAPEKVLFGAPYQVRMEYTGAQTVAVNEKRMQADRVVVSFKGPASDLNFEMFLARDAARTPLVFRAPFAMGTFSMELAP